MDNPHFPRVTIALARKTMTPERFAEEMEARGRKPSGLVLPEFDPVKHVARVPLAQLMQPFSDWRVVPVIDWGFSKAHASICLIRQGINDPSPTVILADEIVFERAGHETIIRAVSQKLNQFPRSMWACVVVDPEGGAGDKADKFMENRAASIFFRQKHGIRVVFERDKARRGIMSTMDLVRRLLKTADGVQRFWISAECAALPSSQRGGRGTLPAIQAYKLEEIGSTGTYKDKAKDDNKNTHAIDCLRMLCICAPTKIHRPDGGMYSFLYVPQLKPQVPSRSGKWR